MKVQDLKIQYECAHHPHGLTNSCAHARGSHEPSCYERLYFEEQEKRCLKALKESLAKRKADSSQSE